MPRVQKHLTLLHELVHIAEEKLLLGKIIHRRSGEARVAHFATTLFGMLAMSGLWTGVSPGEAELFYAGMVRRQRSRSRKRARTKKKRTRLAR